MGVTHGSDYDFPTLDLNFARTKSLIDTVTGRNLVTFTRSQSNYRSTYVGSDGLIKYAAADEPRFDHDPTTGVCNGLLIEESRINGVSNNNDLGSLSAIQSTKVPNALTAPDGTLTAIKLIENTTNTRHYLNGGGSEASNTRSIYAKAGERRRIFLSDSSQSWATFDLISGVIVLSFNCTASISNAGNGWYRCSISHTSFNGICWWGLNTDTGFSYESYQGDGVSGAYFWGAQTELGSFPTSYIPTSGSTVTRTADNATITGTNFSSWYNQSENTVFCQGISNSRENSSYYTLQGVSSNGSSVLVYPINTITWQVFDASFQVNASISSYNSVSTVKFATVIKSNDFAAVINGGSVFTDNSGTVPTVSSLVIGNYLGGGTSYDYSGTISRLTYYPKRLPNYQLQYLTR